MLKYIEKLANPIVIFALILISLDAYNINNFPIQYMGFIVLFFLALTLIKKNVFHLTSTVYVGIVIMFVPLFFSFKFTKNFNLLIAENVRVFNLISFFIVFLFFYSSFKFAEESKFFYILERLIIIIAFFSLYLYVAQIFDFPEFNRNRPGTKLLGSSQQITFWPYQTHRLLGTFREPVLFVSYFSPLYLLTLKFKKKPSNIFIFLSSLSIGLASSDLVIIYFSIFLFVYIFISVFSYFKAKIKLKISKKLIFGLSLPIIFSFLTINECNINPQSYDCTQLDIDNALMTKIYDFDSYQELNDLDEDRINIFNYFISKGTEETSLGLYKPLKNYSNYLNFNLNIEQYLTNRTLPEYLSTRYLAQNFGTGNYSILKYFPNFQNLFVYIYLTYGSILLVLIASIFIFSFYFSKNKINIIYLHMIIFLFFLIPVEELTAYTGLIFGICYKILNKEVMNEQTL